jgi:hypothetical protein
VKGGDLAVRFGVLAERIVRFKRVARNKRRKDISGKITLKLKLLNSHSSNWHSNIM